MKAGMKIIAKSVLIDTRSNSVLHESKLKWMNLSEYEWCLLMCISKGKGRVVGSPKIYSEVWGRKMHSDDPFPPIMRRMVQRLRGKIGTSKIHVVRGHGYRLGVPA